MIAERFHQNRHLLARLYFKHIGREEKSPGFYFYLGVIWPAINLLELVFNALGRLGSRPKQFVSIVKKPADHQNESDNKNSNNNRIFSLHIGIISLLMVSSKCPGNH